ncbi:hypothetical protein [Micromonospora sp. NPDC049679]|uniref:hypothetical protein n=1 Tax=Micromonospora sp. NPDC049679 TaxID=3155920 RepID=UPI0033F12D18
MKYRAPVLVGVALAAVAAISSAVALQSEPETAARVPVAASSAAAAPEGPDESFIAATAQHLCGVQSRVYDNPKALADDYRATPTYAGLTPAQVRAFQQRLAVDREFSARLTAKLRADCRPTASPTP